MTTFRIRCNRAGHWDVQTDRRKPPVATFITHGEALDWCLDQARVRTAAVEVISEFEAPKGRFSGFFQQKGRL